MYGTILVPVDGSEPSRRALAEALELAASTGAVVHALYVVDTSAAGWAGLGDEEFGVEVGQVLEYLEEEGETTVADAEAAAEDAGVEFVGAVEEGTPSRAIVEYADERGVDLIVMGTHGRRGLDRYLLGSTTERVVRRAPVPVLTVRFRGEEEEEEG